MLKFLSLVTVVSFGVLGELNGEKEEKKKKRFGARKAVKSGRSVRSGFRLQRATSNIWRWKLVFWLSTLISIFLSHFQPRQKPECIDERF